MADLIYREAARNALYNADALTMRGVSILNGLPTVDAVEVVRCARCKHGIWNEEEGLWMCVFTADYDEKLGEYYGFIQNNTADYYCADGERRADNGQKIYVERL